MKKRQEKKQKPYWLWTNPFFSWIDKVIASFFPMILNIGNLGKFPPTLKNKGTRKELEKQRNDLNQSDTKGVPSWIKMMKKLYGDSDIVECTLHVKRNESILKDWGIILDQEDNDDSTTSATASSNDESIPLNNPTSSKNKKDNYQESTTTSTISVLLRFPMSILPSEIQEKLAKQDKNKFGCFELSQLDFNSIDAPNIPIFLWFHGGGQTIGGVNCEIGFTTVCGVLALEQAKQQQQQTNGKSAALPLIYASIDYRLAPEHLFPAAPVDGINVLNYFFQNTNCPVHVGGVSGGSYPCIISTFACEQHYPGKIKSAFTACGMLSPSANSESYYLNSRSDGACPIPFLRWSWQSVFALNGDSDQVCMDAETHARLWRKSVWSQSENLRRFAEPAQFVPHNKTATLALCRFVVGMCKGDPLHDDSLLLVKQLRVSGYEVTAFETLGNHVFGFLAHFDKGKELLNALRFNLFEGRRSGIQHEA